MYFDFWLVEEPVRHEVFLLIAPMVFNDEMPDVVEDCFLGAGRADDSVFLFNFAVLIGAYLWDSSAMRECEQW